MQASITPAASAQAAGIQLDDLVGSYGSYQFTITLYLFVRNVFLGLMANCGPLFTPDVTFYCELPADELEAIMPNITLLNKTEQDIEAREELKRICQLDLHLYQQAYLNHTAQWAAVNKITNVSRQTPPQWTAKSAHFWRNFNASQRYRECTDFTYDIAPDQGLTMTSEFDLVCDDDSLRSIFQSSLSVAIVIAHVFWGTYSDRHGRYAAQRFCTAISLIAGTFSVFARDFWTFTLLRALTSFGDLGLVVSLATTVVELVGSPYRGTSVAISNFGYALGVTMLPYLVAYCENFRTVIAFTVMCHLCTIPMLFACDESARWLLTQRRYAQAKRELKRIRRINALCARAFACCSAQQQPPSPPRGRPPDDTIKKQKEKANDEFEALFERLVRDVEYQDLCDPHCHNQGFDLDACSTPEDGHRSRVASRSSAVPDNVQTQQPVKQFEQTEPTKQQVDRNNNNNTDTDMNFPQRSQSASPEKLQQRQISAACVQRALSCPHIPVGSTASNQSARHSFISLTLPANSSTISLDLSRSSSYAFSNIMHLKLADERGAIARHLGGCQQPGCINVVAHQLSFMGRVNRLFRDKRLMIAVFTIVWTTFNSELLYISFIIINLEVGEDVYLNYMLGGCMEALASIASSLLLWYAPRRATLIAFWLLISLSCFGLAASHIDSTWAVWLLALAKFSQSSLSTIAQIASFEAFPTFLRQSGSGLVSTLGMLGSVFAPLIFAEMDDHDSMDLVLFTFSLCSLSAAALIYFFLKETRDCDLR